MAPKLDRKLLAETVASDVAHRLARTVSDRLQLEPARNRIDYIAQKFTEAMISKGFSAITAKDVDEAAYKTGMWNPPASTGIIMGNEVVFNVGVNTGASNFYVFMKKRDDAIDIFYTNPRSDDVALTLTHEELYIYRTISADTKNFDRAITKIMGEMEGVSHGKFAEDIRMQTHNHSGYAFDRGWKLADDGSSNLADVIRKAMLYHTDVWNYTPHNSSDVNLHVLLDAVCKAVGMTYMAGTELTGTPNKDGINGPHAVLMFAAYGPGSAEEIVRKQILSRRDDGLEMQSYFRGMAFEEMNGILQDLRAKDILVMGFGHPVNYNSRSLPIKAVGVLSQVDEGVCTMDQAIESIRRTDMIETYNASISIYEEMKLKDFDFRSSLMYLMAKHKMGNVLTANAGNMSAAREAREQLGIGTFYGSDEHDTTPLDQYKAGGDGFGYGFTRIRLLKEGLFKKLREEKRNPTPAEIVEWLATGQAQMKAKVFYEIRDIEEVKTNAPRRTRMERLKYELVRGWQYLVNTAQDVANFVRRKPDREEKREGMFIHKARTQSPSYTRMERWKLKVRQTWNYFEALMHDAWSFAMHGDYRRLFHMSK